MNKLLSIIILSIIIGCGTNKQLSIDPTFQSQFDHFNFVAKKLGKNITIDNLIIKFGTVDNNTIAGECFNSQTPVIVINNYDWDKIDSLQRLNLIMHEMGHCILKRQHTQVNNGQCPLSYMYPDVLTDYCIKQVGIEALDNELFNGG